MGLARVSPRFAHRPAWRCGDARAVPRSRFLYGARRAPARGRPRRRPYRRGHPGGPAHVSTYLREARLPRDLRFGDLRFGARVMERSALAAAIDRSAALAMRLHMIGDDRTERRHGLAVARRAGLVCLSSTEMPDELFTRALGSGTFRAHARRRLSCRGSTSRAQWVSRGEGRSSGPRPRAHPRAPSRRERRSANRAREARGCRPVRQARVTRLWIEGSDRPSLRARLGSSSPTDRPRAFTRGAFSRAFAAAPFRTRWFAPVCAMAMTAGSDSSTR